MAYRFDFLVLTSTSGRSQVDLPCHQDVNLWIDSTDFPLENKPHGKKTKSRHWSFKLNRRGRRYMFIRDGRVLRFVSDGYSPKTHDGTYLEIERRTFSRDFVVST